MKLKKEFIAHEIEGTQYLVPVGGEAFHGIVRSNSTAAFIVERLKQDTNEQDIVDAMCAQYNASRDIIASDVKEILNVLRNIHALEE